VESWLALGEANVVLSGLKGLKPSLHVLLEDLLVLALLGILRDEVAATAGFVLVMIVPPCHEAGCLGLPQEPQATALAMAFQPSFSRASHGLKNKTNIYNDRVLCFVPWCNYKTKGPYSSLYLHLFKYGPHIPPTCPLLHTQDPLQLVISTTTTMTPGLYFGFS
jgi:hypothetical protein